MNIFRDKACIFKQKHAKNNGILSHTFYFWLLILKVGLSPSRKKMYYLLP